jgi:hypothetical protein
MAGVHEQPAIDLGQARGPGAEVNALTEGHAATSSSGDRRIKVPAMGGASRKGHRE